MHARSTGSRRRAQATVLAIACAALMSSCGSSVERSASLDSIASDYLAPAYADLGTATASLEGAVHAACTAVGPATLAASREAWMAAHRAWKHTEAAWFGPTMVEGTIAAIGSEPVSETGIDATIDAIGSEVPTVDVESLPASRAGLGAIEYVLFADTDLDDVRCAYVEAVASLTSATAGALDRSWNDAWDGGASFVDRFRGTSEAEIDQGFALGDITESIVALLKLLTLDQLGRALGITSPQPDPAAFPEGASASGLDTLRSQLGGIDAAYGTAPSGLSGAVAERDAGLDADIRAHIDAATSIVDALIASDGASFARAADAHADELAQLYDHLAELRRTFETDVVSALDIMLGYVGGDGDTG